MEFEIKNGIFSRATFFFAWECFTFDNYFFFGYSTLALGIVSDITSRTLKKQRVFFFTTLLASADSGTGSLIPRIPPT